MLGENRSRWLRFVAAGLWLSLPAAASGATPRDETERWVPAFAVFSGVVVEEDHGRVSSDIRPGASGHDRLVTPFVGGSLELMTPALADVPGRPRLFVHGDAAASFSTGRDLAKEGVPDVFSIPPGVNFPTANVVQGQGSATSAEVETLLVSAGLGVAFTVDAWERRIRIKPSVEYLREEIEVTGIVNRAFPDVVPARGLEDFRLVSLRASDSEVYHGLGPGLEVELDAARTGPFVLSVFLGGKALAFLGDLEFDLSETNEDDESAAWQFEKDRWAYQGGVGLRFRWVPEEP
jgi:hypothetical protein